MIKVKQLKIDVQKDTKENIINALAQKLSINKNEITTYKIIKKSIDARKKEHIYYIYEIDVDVSNIKKIKFNIDISLSNEKEYSYEPSGNTKINSRPIIIGSGPCGLFCAYKLAQYGYKPIIFERGEEIDKRIKTVSQFWETNQLNPNSNVQFGEGGAGTFSDGKLSTQIKDKNNRIKEILKIFIDNGAPNEIMYDFMPHIGTDKLVNVVKNMRNKIISLGGEIHYNSCLTDIIINNNNIKKIIINDKEITCDLLVLAIGHSARDTFKMLNEKGIKMQNKPFAVGMRIMHPQEMINKNQYGKYYKYLKPASYKLTYNTKEGRGVYSFCMCPGGYVVNASSTKDGIVVNGMSNHDRESKIANSAIVVTVSSKDYGENLFDGIKFQEQLEKKAFTIGKGYIPVEKYGDYLNKQKPSTFTKLLPEIKGKYTIADLNQLFNDDINKAIKEGIQSFNQKIKGFNDEEVILAGVESRTSSPIRIYRDENLISNIDNIYPGGEGAGYAGGIISSAVDGIKIFEKITSKYKAN